MVSQDVSGSGQDVLEICSYVRGYHEYSDLWTPTIGQVLRVKPEPTNEKDWNAVAVFKEDMIVRHVPRNLSPRLFQFLRRDVNKEVTGQKVNRGAGYGLEIPCTYRLYSPPADINRMKELVASLAAYGHIIYFCFRVWYRKGCSFDRCWRQRAMVIERLGARFMTVGPSTEVPLIDVFNSW